MAQVKRRISYRIDRDLHDRALNKIENQPARYPNFSRMVEVALLEYLDREDRKDLMMQKYGKKRVERLRKGL